MSKAAATTMREPATERLERMRDVILPVVIKEITYAQQAFEMERRHSVLAFVTLAVDDTDTVDRTLLGKYTQPVIAMGVLRCRYLLEFLGIKAAGAPPELQAVSRRSHDGDIGIEHFTRSDGRQLARVTPVEAASLFPAHPDTLTAWATVITIAGQRLAHPTDDAKLSGRGLLHDELALTFATIPELLCVKFYDSLSVERPRFMRSA